MATEIVEFKKGRNSFSLTGRLRITPNSFTLDKVSESGFTSNRAYIGVDCGDGNVVYAQMFDGYNDKKKLFIHGSKLDDAGKKVDDFTDKMEVEWRDRFNKDVLEEAGPQCFVKIGLQKRDDGKLKVVRYLSEYDAINYLYEIFKDMPSEERDRIVVNVSGDLSYNYYEGKVKVQKNIRSISAVDVAESAFKAEFTQTVYANKDSIGKADLQTNTMPLSVYVPEYVGKYKGTDVKATVPLPFDMTLDCSQSHADAAKYIATTIASSSNFCRATIIGTFKELGNTEQIDINKLDPQIRMAIQTGCISVEEIEMIAAQGSSRVQQMFINGVRVYKDDSNEEEVDINKKMRIDVEANVYKESELIDLAGNFMKIVTEVDAGDNKAEAVVSNGTGNTDGVAPFDTSESEVDLSWLKNFA